MNKIVIYFTLFLLWGCNRLPSNPSSNLSSNSTNNTTTISTEECPQQSPSLSDSENLEIASTSVSRSALLSSNNGKAYEFDAKSGQILSFSLDNEEICTWVFDPSGNQIDLTSSAEMPMDGTYSIYLWNPQGKKTFNLSMGLQDKLQPVVKSNTQPKTTKSQTTSQENSNNQINATMNGLNNNIQSIGWIRIGAIKGQGEVFSGQQMIQTAQPITIAPTNVPNIGDKVSIITNVNLRESFPQPPEYELADSLSQLSPNQDFYILDIQTFVDYQLSSNRVIWAKIGR